MQSDSRLLRVRVRPKLIIGHAAVTVAAIIVAVTVALGATALFAPEPATVVGVWKPTAALIILGSALAALPLGAWATHRLGRRLQRALDVTSAWLRGNLSLRMADPTADDLALLFEQLDLLAEQLENDEQDLGTLREHNSRLGDQVRALAVVEERNRLARELHDSVKQHLFSLAVTASGIRARFESLEELPADLAEMLVEVETTAQTAQREMTRLIEDLRPVPLHDQGLAAALDDFTLVFGAREHLLVYLEVQGNDVLLPPSISRPLYLIAQEALHNVARHARATRVDVHLRCIPEQVALTVRDNGVGFDRGRARRGLGLANMQERMLSVGGRLSVESRIGAGTTVTADLSLAHRLGPPVQSAHQETEYPRPSIDNWSWLGQRLVIPVGQTWPWLPADETHLRSPLVDTRLGPLVVQKRGSFLGLAASLALTVGQLRRALLHVYTSRSGYEWEADGASWALRRIRGLSGRRVLTRDGQALAAMQYQGRVLNAWTEIVYDGRGYRISLARSDPSAYVLVDEAGDDVFRAEVGPPTRIELRRALPLPLVVTTALRIAEEVAQSATSPELSGTRHDPIPRPFLND